MSWPKVAFDLRWLPLVHTQCVLSASMQNVRADRNRRARTAMARV